MKTKTALLTLLTLLSIGVSCFSFTNISAGPIWNNNDAQLKCTVTCQQNGYDRWNGQWRTVEEGVNSVCQCTRSHSQHVPRHHWHHWHRWHHPVINTVSAGPIWNNNDAQLKCADICQQQGYRRWNGQWRTVEEGVNSVCQCVR